MAKKSQPAETKCYTYKVEIILHAFAESEESARGLIDGGDGFMASRKVFLLDSVSLINE